MPIRELAQESVAKASPETTVPGLASRMRDEKVGSVVITNEADPVGSKFSSSSATCAPPGIDSCRR